MTAGSSAAEENTMSVRPIAFAVLAAGFLVAAGSVPARADWDDHGHRNWHEHEAREHAWHEHEEHERYEHRGYGYGYAPPVVYQAPRQWYAPPAVVYRAPGW